MLFTIFQSTLPQKHCCLHVFRIIPHTRCILIRLTGRALRVKLRCGPKTQKISDTENFASQKSASKYLDIIGMKLLRRPGQFLAKYPWQGGCSEGGRWSALSWLHARSRPGRSCFVPYLVDALENEICEQPQSWLRIV